MLPYLLVILGGTATVIADWFAKSWSLNRIWTYLAIAGLLYLVTGISFAVSLTMGKLTVLNAFWSVFIFLASTILGALVFHESVNGIQKTALAFGFVSIFLFALTGVTK